MRAILLFLFLLVNLPASGQRKVPDTAWVKGCIAAGAPDAMGIYEVAIPRLKLRTFTKPGGLFVFRQVPYGNYVLVIRNALQDMDTFRIFVDLDTTDLGLLPVQGRGMSLQEADLYASGPATDLSLDNPELSPDPADRFNPADLAVRAWTATGYRYRGYDRKETAIRINGLPVQDLQSAGIPRGLWSGINGLLVSSSRSYGLQFTESPPDNFAGTALLRVNAADQLKQTRIMYGRSNGIWANRAGLNYSTGMMPKGWAIALSAGKTWSGQSYVPGTCFNEYSFYLGISRKLNAVSMLHLTALATPVESGNTSAVTAEAATLAGSHYYNPNWGYQDDEERNARISKSLQPVFLLNYTYKVDSNTHIDLGIASRNGYSAYTALDWYNAPDPRPDYYKNLPGAYKDDPATAEQIRQEWLNNPDKRQLDWTRMYEANRLNTDTLNRHRSVYTLAADRADIQQYSIAAHLMKKREHSTLHAGLNYEWQRTEYYRKMEDLLGGDYYVNLNQFAEQSYVGNTTFNQNDLNHPDRLVYTGDKYGYNYISRYNRATAWSQLRQEYERVSIFAAAHAQYHRFSREGRYRTGMFPESSYGKSELQQFFTYLVKAGASYALQPGHHFFLNAGTGTAAPAFDHTFIAPRSRNTTIGHPLTAQRTSAEAGYDLHTRSVKGRLAFFTADRSRITEIKRFYHEDYKSFVNYVMEGVRIRHMGAELALEATITSFLSATAAVTWMEVRYHSRPMVSIYKDNDTTGKADKHIAYLKGYYVAGPQSALFFGLNFRMPAYGYATVRCRMLDRNYTDINPERRTDAAVGLTLPGSPEQERILQQERLPQALAVDLSAGKTFYLHPWRGDKWRRTALSLRVGVTNILNNKNIVMQAYEQLRFDYKGRDPDRFPNKYTYAYGAVYTLELSLRL